MVAREASSIAARAAHLKLLLFDVDGTLTDGTVRIRDDGSESKVFSIRDGAGLVLAQRAGLEMGFLSARHSAATLHRATQLAVKVVEQSSMNKLAVYERLLSERGLGDADVGFMGDDLLDLPVLKRVGLAACPADAVVEVRHRAHWVSGLPGGRGAVREFIELVLKARGDWPGLLARIEEDPGP